MSVIPLDQLTLATFQPHVNETFTAVPAPGQSIAMTLYQATPLAIHNYPNKAARDPFQLRFKAPGLGMLPQQIYHLHHAVLGEMDIFLVPITPEDGEFCYQAVFN